MAIKGFEILLWFLIIPLAAGNLPVFETGKEKDWFVRMADALICGYVLLFAVFELLALPLIFTRQSFAVLKYSYEILVCVLALAGVIFAWKNKKNRADGAERKKSLSRKKIPAAMWLAFLLVAIQMGAYVFGMATDLDDAFMWQRQPRLWRRTGCSRTMPIPECWHRIFRRDMCLHRFRSCLHSTVIWCICMRRLWHIRSNRSSFF